MCMTMKGSYSRLSYNTNNGDSAAWNQYGGTGVTLTTDMRSRMASKGSDPSKLGQWTWVRIEGKAGESIVFVSAYPPCKSTNGMDTVRNDRFHNKTTNPLAMLSYWYVDKTKKDKIKTLSL